MKWRWRASPWAVPALLAALCWLAWGSPDDSNAASMILPDPSPVFAAWQQRNEEKRLETRLRAFLDNNDPYGIYDLQLQTQTQLIWLQNLGQSPGKSAMIDSFVRLYTIPLHDLEPGIDARGQAIMGWICGAPKQLQPELECRAAEGEETFLYAVQFLYGAAKLLRVIAEIPEPQRSPAQILFSRQMSPVLASHLDRWLVQCESLPAAKRSPWRCLNPSSGAVTDKFMQFAAAISEATTAAPHLAALASAIASTTSEQAGFRRFLSVEVVPGLFARVKLFPSSTPGLKRAIFDAGWSVNSEIDKDGVNRSANHCAYYASPTPAGRTSQCTAPQGPAGEATTTMDISHYVRSAFLFETLGHDLDPDIRVLANRTIPLMARHFVEQVIVSEVPWQLANYFGDSNGNAPRGWNRLFFGKSGALLPSCATMTRASTPWQDCAPYVPVPPGGYSDRTAYFIWAPDFPPLAQAAAVYYQQFPPTSSRDFAIQSLTLAR